MMAEHECLFAEEREESGRLILGPCLTCDTPALEGMQYVKERLALAEDVIWRARVAFMPLDDGADDATEGDVLEEVSKVLVEYALAAIRALGSPQTQEETRE